MSSNFSVALVELIRRIVAPMLLLFGVILVVSGFLNAFSTTELLTLDNQVITTYPKLYVGIMMSIIGLATTIVSYLIFHDKIKLQKIIQ